MVVLTKDRHSGYVGAVGLHVGSENAQQYFPRDLTLVELELDHLRIVCQLEPSFWQDQPEIHDQRLSSWLELKRNSGKLASQDAPVAMIPCGKYTFRLQIISKDETEKVLTGPPTPAYFAPVVSPLKLLDRRRHGLARKPERRKVAKLKLDDRASVTAND
jgi:hypothetical protein